MLLAAPKLLLDALIQVQREHPYAIDGEITESPRTLADTDALWKRLLATRKCELPDALSGLSDLEVRIALFGARTRMESEDVLRVLAELFATRKPAGAGALAWDGWLLSGYAGFREASTEHVREHPSRSLWPRLLSSTPPLKEAARALEQANKPFAAWAAQPTVGLAEHTYVVDAIRRLLLSREHLGATCRREPHGAIVQWVNSLVPADEREAWYRAFLCETYRSGWPKDSELLGAIVERFGRPEGQRPFWKALPVEVCREVNGWLNGIVIEQLLEGRRAEFWLRYRYDITRIERSRAGDAVFVGFDTWFAVQYKEMGKATYMFRNDFWNRLRWKDEPALYAREILGLARTHHHLGRYTHQADYWEASAQAEVGRVIREQRRLP